MLKKQPYNKETENRLKALEEWCHSQEYDDACNYYLSEADHLFKVGASYQAAIVNSEQEILQQAVRIEYSSYGGLHRGLYCPSLVLDLIVGNITRGKKWSRPSSKSKNYFVYGFDRADRLIWIKQFYNAVHIYTEFLFYQERHVYGVTLESSGQLQAVSSERYEEGRLHSYDYVLFQKIRERCECQRMTREEYSFDEKGLCTCDVHEFTPQNDCAKKVLSAILGVSFRTEYRKKRFHFERKDGYLTQYRSEEIIGGKDDNTRFGRFYEIKKKRKA